jgi:hypothetical protein
MPAIRGETAEMRGQLVRAVRHYLRLAKRGKAEKAVVVPFTLTSLRPFGKWRIANGWSVGQ